MPVLKNLAASGLGSITAYILYKLVAYLVAPFFSPLRALPGPPNPSWFHGHFKEIFSLGPSERYEQWLEVYGPTMRFKTLFNKNRVLSVDLKALNHFLVRTDIYEKPETTRHNFTRVFGPEGLLITEGEHHKRQRKAMNPAFGPSQVRDLTGIFLDKSNQLRDVWLNMSASSSTDSGTSLTDAPAQPVRVDILSWLSRATLDIIGLAGFNYSIDALTATKENPNPLNEALSVILETPTEYSVLPYLAAFIPALRNVPSPVTRAAASSNAILNPVSARLLEEKKNAVQSGKNTDEKATARSRDLLSVLVRANMTLNQPEHQRLSDRDVLAQVPTFVFAGHETTGTAITWALYAMSLAPGVQSKLREEVSSFALPTASADNEPLDAETIAALNALPYLDAVVRETLRLHTPITETLRVATRDDVVPLARPVVDRYGVTRESLTITKGDLVVIPILAVNRSKELWGEDAMEFNPDRWLNIPEATSAVPGPWSNLLSFIAGPRVCIGYRFALLEMKILLAVLVRAFAFQLAVEPSDIMKRTYVVTRPVVISEKENGNQMPFLITPLNPEEAG